MTGTPTYKAWLAMIDRCCTPSSAAYAHYGAKGITVCDRWRNSFPAFLEDMGWRLPRMTLDRIDNAKGYEPGNCRWATMYDQQNNRTNNVTLTHAGRTLNLVQWSRVLGLDRSTIRRRLAAGATDAEALSQIRHGRGGKPLAGR